MRCEILGREGERVGEDLLWLMNGPPWMVLGRHNKDWDIFYLFLKIIFIHLFERKSEREGKRTQAGEQKRKREKQSSR